MAKKYLSLERLKEYDDLIKAKIDEGDDSVKTYTDEKIALLMNNSSDAVDSIMELVTAMEENEDVVAAINTAVGKKVDKVSGKGLSTNDLTDTLKSNYDTAYSHVSNKNNPHGVTLSQLGVTATAAELNYMDGVTSNVQTQLNAKVPTTRTVNGKALSSNITLSASDIGSYSKTDIDNMVFITVEDIDDICGATIQSANDMTF